MSRSSCLRNHFQRLIVWCHDLEAAPTYCALHATTMNSPNAMVDYYRYGDVPFQTLIQFPFVDSMWQSTFFLSKIFTLFGWFRRIFREKTPQNWYITKAGKIFIQFLLGPQSINSFFEIILHKKKLTNFTLLVLRKISCLSNGNV